MNPKKLITTLLSLSLLWACANIGNPEGGPFDIDPPRLIKAKPEQRALNVQAQRIVLEFDEFVRISQQDKIIVSPPQRKQPIITTTGKGVSVKLLDSLRPNTTYSIYFDDAIEDNNEGNPLEGLDYTFSTGSQIDTMQIGGLVLDAETLEPIAKLVVGAYPDSDWRDSLVIQEGFPFAGKTDKQGRFVIRGLRDTTYRIFALKDDDNDFRYNPYAEGFAFLSKQFKTSKLDSIKTDTIRIDSIVRRDTLHRDSLVTYNHTYYYPNDIVLRYFSPKSRRLGLERSGREDSLRINLEFSEELQQAPILHSLDKVAQAPDALYYTSLDKHTATYWLKDKELINADSIRFAITYSKTDSLMQIVQQSDTLTFMRPRSKSESKKKPKGEEQAQGGGPKPFQLTFSGAKGIEASTPQDSLILTSNLPIQGLNTSHIRLEASADSIYTPQPYRLQRDSLKGLQYSLHFERKYAWKYRVRIDSAGIHSIYGHPCDSIVFEQRVEEEKNLGALQIRLEGLDNKLNYIAQLLDKGGNPLRSLSVQMASKPLDSLTTLAKDSLAPSDSLPTASPAPTTLAWQVEFTDLKPDTYYLRMFVDDNGDKVWTSGAYPERLPELMLYSPEKYEVKKSFTTSETWKPYALPAHKQKPLELLRTKPEEKKKRENKNIEYYQRLEDKKRKL